MTKNARLSPRSASIPQTMISAAAITLGGVVSSWVVRTGNPNPRYSNKHHEYSYPIQCVVPSMIIGAKTLILVSEIAVRKWMMAKNHVL